jgi:hypothetical protein
MAQSRSLFDVSLRTPQDVQADLRAQIAQAGAMGRVGGGQSGSAAINSAFSQIGAGLGAVLGGQYQDQMRAAQAAEQVLGESQAAIQQAVAERGDPLLAQRDEFLKAATKLRSVNPQASREMMQKYIELDQMVTQQRAAAAQLRAEQARESRKEDADLSESVAGLQIKREKYRSILSNPNAPRSAQEQAARILGTIDGDMERVMNESKDWEVLKELPVVMPDGTVATQTVALNLNDMSERIELSDPVPMVDDSDFDPNSIAGMATVYRRFVEGSEANQAFAVTANDLITLVTENPEALGGGSSTAAFGAKLESHAKSFIAAAAGPEAIEWNIKEERENGARWQGMMVEAGINNAQAQALTMDIAYALASSLENGGRLSDEDIKRAITIMGGGTPDPRALVSVLGSLAERRMKLWEGKLRTTGLTGNNRAEGSWSETQSKYDQLQSSLDTAYERFGLNKEAAENFRLTGEKGWLGSATDSARSGQFELVPPSQQQRRPAAPTAGRVLNVTPVTQ